MTIRVFKATSLPIVIALLSPWASVADDRDEKKLAAKAKPILCREPADIGSRDLRFGVGSPALAPVAPFVFVEEIKSGESPKFEVRDARGVRWRVKLGPEAQTEIVSSRLIWAVGYFAEESYYFERARIQKLPRLSRGEEYVRRGGIVVNAVFEPRRKNVIRGPVWDWNDNPFRGTRELSGLKVLMILLNNYDARKENNHILLVRGNNRIEARYVVTDLGASLGKAAGLGGGRSKNDLSDFLSTRFVRGVEDGAVQFDYDTRPAGFGVLSILYPPYYRGQVKKERSMRGIPIAHARWIGSLLGRLSDNQIRTAFRAGRYDPATREGYVKALRERIRQVSRL